MTIKMKTARKTEESTEQTTPEVKPVAPSTVKTKMNFTPEPSRKEPQPGNPYADAKTVETTPFGQTIYRF